MLIRYLLEFNVKNLNSSSMLKVFAVIFCASYNTAFLDNATNSVTTKNPKDIDLLIHILHPSQMNTIEVGKVKELLEKIFGPDIQNLSKRISLPLLSLQKTEYVPMQITTNVGYLENFITQFGLFITSSDATAARDASAKAARAAAGIEWYENLVHLCCTNNIQSLLWNVLYKVGKGQNNNIDQEITKEFIYAIQFLSTLLKCSVSEITDAQAVRQVMGYLIIKLIEHKDKDSISLQSSVTRLANIQTFIKETLYNDFIKDYLSTDNNVYKRAKVNCLINALYNTEEINKLLGNGLKVGPSDLTEASEINTQIVQLFTLYNEMEGIYTAPDESNWAQILPPQYKYDLTDGNYSINSTKYYTLLTQLLVGIEHINEKGGSEYQQTSKKQLKDKLKAFLNNNSFELKSSYSIGYERSDYFVKVDDAALSKAITEINYTYNIFEKYFNILIDWLKSFISEGTILHTAFYQRNITSAIFQMYKSISSIPGLLYIIKISMSILPLFGVYIKYNRIPLMSGFIRWYTRVSGLDELEVGLRLVAILVIISSYVQHHYFSKVSSPEIDKLIMVLQIPSYIAAAGILIQNGFWFGSKLGITSPVYLVDHRCLLNAIRQFGLKDVCGDVSAIRSILEAFGVASASLIW